MFIHGDMRCLKKFHGITNILCSMSQKGKQLTMVVNHTCKVIEFEKELIKYHHYNLFYDVFMVSKDEIPCSILIHTPFSSTQKVKRIPFMYVSVTQEQEVVPPQETTMVSLCSIFSFTSCPC